MFLFVSRYNIAMSTAILEKESQVNEVANTGKKQEIPIDSLHVENFRCFKNIFIPRIGRINLITGKNNVGKTTFLETIWLLSEGGHNSVAFSIAEKRGEIKYIGKNIDYVNSFKLFFNSTYANLSESKFTIYSKLMEVYGTISNEGRVSFGYDHFLSSSNSGEWEWHLGFRPDIYSLRNDPRFRVKNFFVFASGLTDEEIKYHWGKIEYTDAEDEVTKCLNILMGNNDDIQRVGLRSVPVSSNPLQPYVRIHGNPEPTPLSHFGAGMSHLFNIAITLVNSSDGILIIDEIENGLHYSVLPDVWELIFETAKRLNVQVFATTHSKECIEAFQKVAAQDDDPESGMLIRLANRDGDIVATNFDEEELEVMVRRGLEVR